MLRLKWPSLYKGLYKGPIRPHTSPSIRLAEPFAPSTILILALCRVNSNLRTLRWRPSTPSPKTFSSKFSLTLSLSRPRLTKLPVFGFPFISRAQDPVLVYRAPSYNYHLPPDLDRSARCGLFEDHPNAYATSSSEASPCLATPQTLHPTQTFGNTFSSFPLPSSAHPNPLPRSPSSYLQPTRANAVRREPQQRVFRRRNEARHLHL